MMSLFRERGLLRHPHVHFEVTSTNEKHLFNAGVLKTTPRIALGRVKDYAIRSTLLTEKESWSSALIV
jgi:hypothetical protein